MALLVDEPKLTQEESITKIMDTEAYIVQNMSKFLDETFAPKLLTMVDANEAITSSHIDAFVQAFKKIMCGFATKEESIACIINSITKLLAVEKGISPCDLECCLMECKCNCNLKK